MLRAISCAFFLAVAAYAQSTGTASIVGAITVSSGAAVPRAKIVVQNQQTAFLYESTSTESGDYYIPNLSSGTYQITVEATGFHSRGGIPCPVVQRLLPSLPVAC